MPNSAPKWGSPVHSSFIEPPLAAPVTIDPVPESIVAPEDGDRHSINHLAHYKYRDPDKWRAYMRDYMAKRRARI